MLEIELCHLNDDSCLYFNVMFVTLQESGQHVLLQSRVEIVLEHLFSQQVDAFWFMTWQYADIRQHIMIQASINTVIFFKAGDSSHNKPPHTKSLHQLSQRAFMLAAEHKEKDNPWVTDISLNIAEQLEASLLKCNNVSNLGQLMCREGEHCFKQVFLELQPKISKAVWKQNPAAVQVWISIHL